MVRVACELPLVRFELLHELASRALQGRREIAKLGTISRVDMLVEGPIDGCSTGFCTCEIQALLAHLRRQEYGLAGCYVPCIATTC